jgi:transcription-repair coupling factor (superfamily II helicase)
MVSDRLLVFLRDTEDFRYVTGMLGKDSNEELISGIVDSQKAYFVSALYRACEGKNVLVVTSDSRQASLWYNDLRVFLSPQEVNIFPPLEVMAHEGGEGGVETLARRALAIESLRDGKVSVLVVTASSLLQRLIPLEFYIKHIVTLEPGRELDRDGLISRLSTIGYDRVDLVLEKGCFSVRGGILDVFPITYDRPLRIEFFGDEIESIREFDVVTQRSLTHLSNVSITPAREGIVRPDKKDSGIARIQDEAKAFIQSLQRIGKKEEARIFEERIKEDLDKLRQGIYFNGTASYKPYFHEKLDTILDYFSHALLVLDEPVHIEEELRNITLQFTEAHGSLLEVGNVLPGQFQNYTDYSQISQVIRERQRVSLKLLADDYGDLVHNTYSSTIPLKSVPNFNGRVDAFLKELRIWRRMGKKVVIYLSSQKRLERLAQLLREDGIGYIIGQGQDFQWDEREVLLLLGNLTSGLQVFPGELMILTEVEIFGKLKRRMKERPVKVSGKRIESFSDLHKGDFVVHINYGVGKYLGLETMQIGGIQRDFLVIKYAGDDKLYVPADQVGLLQKYVGSEDAPPRLYKLGGVEWNKVKSKVKESVQEMAKELLDLYAVRESIQGHAFAPDTVWQQEFEDTFPYQETPDQIVAIEEIKRDMELSRPMDRLLCGDVGYGKTEVAIRAAFKATMDNKQVAVLVPTTILAQQHYNTFTDRFSNYPMKIKLLSRFQTAAEQKEIIRELRAGTVDIVIGTHRLIQKDVTFKSLGLVIVDEEQRFGVAQKEHLKELRKNVDVLTLSATPIPRTLHMSLAGVRDISVIETPPEDRYPVKTYVLPFNADIIREGIARELRRGGQVYFVHNRVQDIHKVAAFLEELIPEARIGVAHGQLSEGRLERVMLQFLEEEYNVLVCTTIIETGLDIPNVNTLFVMNADRFGLSQLYQLRGRVGRSNRVAYAYLMYQRDKILREDAEKRLQAIKEFVELGSGLKIAMRDLEIRGAGNLLGPEQHGHIAAVGFEMYCKLLEDEVRKLKGEPMEEHFEPVVDIALDAFISDRYITDQRQKIEIYKKIIAIEALEDVADIEMELEDRFGPLPIAVKNLIGVATLKILAREAGVVSVTQKDKTIKLKFLPGVKMPRALVSKISKVYRGKAYFSIDGQQEIKVSLKTLSNEEGVKLIEVFLRLLIKGGKG